MRWNAPLSDAHASLLLDALALNEADTVLDLGCGWAELLTRAVRRTAQAAGIGVDTNPGELQRARTLVSDRALADRVTLVEQPAETWAARRPGPMRRL